MVLNKHNQNASQSIVKPSKHMMKKTEHYRSTHSEQITALPPLSAPPDASGLGV